MPTAASSSKMRWKRLFAGVAACRASRSPRQRIATLKFFSLGIIASVKKGRCRLVGAVSLIGQPPRNTRLTVPCSVFRAVRYHPSPRMFDRAARRLGGAKALHCRQAFHPFAPGADRWKTRIHRLRLGREAKPVDNRQHAEIREAQLRPEQKSRTA